MNAEDLMRAQAEALEMLADQQMRMVRDREVQEALKEVKSPAAKRSVGGVLEFCFEKELVLILFCSAGQAIDVEVHDGRPRSSLAASGECGHRAGL